MTKYDDITADSIAKILEVHLKDRAPMRLKGGRIGKPPFVSDHPGNLRESIRTMARDEGYAVCVVGGKPAAYGPFTDSPGKRTSGWVAHAVHDTITDLVFTYRAKLL